MTVLHLKHVVERPAYPSDTMHGGRVCSGGVQHSQHQQTGGPSANSQLARPVACQLRSTAWLVLLQLPHLLEAGHGVLVAGPMYPCSCSRTDRSLACSCTVTQANKGQNQGRTQQQEQQRKGRGHCAHPKAATNNQHCGNHQHQQKGRMPHRLL